MPNSELESTIKSPNDDLAYASATIARLWTELEFERCEHRKTVEGANHRIEGPEELEAQVAIRETELETYTNEGAFMSEDTRTRNAFVFWRAIVSEIRRGKPGFVVYLPRPASELIKAVAEELAEAQKRPETHYDATKEQIEELRSAREETKNMREDMGAIDVVSCPGGQALKERKRRVFLDAKRKKLKTDGDVPPNARLKSISQAPVDTPPRDPFATLEQQVPKPPLPEPRRAAARSQAGTTANGDAFLAQLEQEVHKKRR
ncbi:hypothetical protein BKA82DRAFT_4347944 [Pisolithus tinctorius]|nr:hypothetical protein BKA82DRAFT_4347944 [Pisolithus tinctorius]